MRHEVCGQKPEGRGEVRSTIPRAERPDDADRANAWAIMGADGCGECTNRNSCVVQITLIWDLVLRVDTGDGQVVHSRALASKAMLARLLKSQLREPLWVPYSTHSRSTDHVTVTGRDYSEKSGRTRLLCRGFIQIHLWDIRVL